MGSALMRMRLVYKLCAIGALFAALTTVEGLPFWPEDTALGDTVVLLERDAPKQAADEKAAEKEAEDALVKQAYKVRDMPEGSKKEEKKKEVLNAAKELEAEKANKKEAAEVAAKEEVAKAEPGSKEAEDAIVKQAYKVRDMPEGSKKEEKKEVLNAAKKLEADKEKQDKNDKASAEKEAT